MHEYYIPTDSCGGTASGNASIIRASSCGGLKTSTNAKLIDNNAVR